MHKYIGNGMLPKESTSQKICTKIERLKCRYFGGDGAHNTEIIYFYRYAWIIAIRHQQLLFIKIIRRVSTYVE